MAAFLNFFYTVVHINIIIPVAKKRKVLGPNVFIGQNSKEVKKALLLKNSVDGKRKYFRGFNHQ